MRLAPRLSALLVCTILLAAALPAIASPEAPEGSPVTSCAIRTIDDKCEAWISAYSTGSASTASGYPHFFNEQLLAISPDGSAVFVTGIELPGTIVTAAYSADTGELLWSARYEGTPEFPNGTPESLSISPDGRRVYVVGIVQESIGMCAGTRFFSNNHGTSVVLAYDTATGALDWAKPVDPQSPPETLATCALSSRVSPDGSTIYAAGWHYIQGPEDEVTISAVISALNAADGSLRWRKEYGDPSSPTIASRLALGPDGTRLYVAASSSAPNGTVTEATLLAYDLTDAQEVGPELAWVARRPVSGSPPLLGAAVSLGVAVSPGGDRILTVSTETDPSDTSGFIATHIEVTAFEANDGTEAWSVPITGVGSPTERGFTMALHPYQPLVFSPEGSTAYVTGNLAPTKEAVGMGAQRPEGFITASIAMADGTRGWTSEYRPQSQYGSALGTAIAASPDGRELYVTGGLQPPTPAGIVNATHWASTVAYDASTGRQSWVALDFDHPGMTDSVAVAPGGGRVFVAGHAKMDPSCSISTTCSSESQSFAMAVRAYDLTEAPTPTPTESPSSSPSESPAPDQSTVTFTDRSATSGQYSDETVLEARLTDSNGDPLAGRALSFELVGDGSRTFNATTNDDGVASVTPTLEEKPGPYQLTVRFAGDEEHAGDADTASFIVDKEDTALELSVHGEDDDKTLRARLSDLDTSSEGIAERTIDFYSDGELIGSVLTDADGVASLPLPPGHRGNNRAYEAVFQGDDFFLGSSDERAGKGKGGNGGGSGGNGAGGDGGRANMGRMLLM